MFHNIKFPSILSTAFHNCSPEKGFLRDELILRKQDAVRDGMNNQLIVAKIMEHLSSEDLKMIRRVNSLWNSLARIELLERTWITISSKEDIIKWNDSFGPINFFPFKLKLKFMDLRTPNFLKLDLNGFFLKFGQYIRHLWIRCSVLDFEGPFWNELVITNRYAPFLEELILESNYFFKISPITSSATELGILPKNRITALKLYSDNTLEDPKYSGVPFQLSQLWNVFPFLHSLSLNNMMESEYDDILRATSKRHPKSKPPIFLTSLQIYHDKVYSLPQIPKEQLWLLCEMDIKLTTLDIDIGETISSEDFKLLLDTHSSFLKKLVIWRGPQGERPSSPGFPFGIHLRKLQFLQIPENVLVSLQFIHFIPNVTKLIISQCDIDPISITSTLLNIEYDFWYDAREILRSPHTKCRTLHFQFDLTANDINLLKFTFPNLVSLWGFSDGIYRLL